MHITELRIRNFRSFLKARFTFKEGVNTLIGENGSGKTNVLHALRLMLDESLERNSIYLRETDFCRDLGSWKGQWIIISAVFADLDPSEGCQLLRHQAGHMDGSNTGTCTFFYRPKKEIRKKLHELTGQADAIDDLLKTLTVNEYEPVFSGRAVGDFLDDAVYDRWAGDHEWYEYPDPEQDDSDVLGVKMQPLYQEVSCTFVRALRDVISELRGYRGNPLLALLRGMESSIAITDADRISEQVRTLNGDISSLGEIKKLAAGIEMALKKAVGHTYGPSVSIESALPDSMEKLLQRLSVLVGESSTSSYRGELQEQSLGSANLIYLALKLLEYELKLSTDRVAHFFLIEEPEAHIHTHIQKTLFANLSSQRTQVIVSTHSTHISSASKVASVNVLAKKDDHAEVYQPALALTAIEVSRLERYLDAVRSTLLFAKGVLLVEGDAEQIMIPALLRAVFGLTPDELGFSVISMDSAFFKHVAIIFAEERIKRPCAIVTDLDRALEELPSDPASDSAQQKHARAAENSGAARHSSLQEFAQGNAWVRTYFAQHTFEADFVMANNAREVVRTLPEIYVSTSSRESSRELLNSDAPGVPGQEMLRLAEKVGKGWFALLLSEKLDPWTIIPEYILRAIAFACHPTVTQAALVRMAEYRMKGQKEGPFESNLPELDTFEGMEADAYVMSYRTAVPEDDLALFCQYLEEYRQA